MDAVTQILLLLDQAPRESWERTLRHAPGGRQVYFSAATGRHQIRQLRDMGLAERTARWKIRGY